MKRNTTLKGQIDETTADDIASRDDAVVRGWQWMRAQKSRR